MQRTEDLLDAAALPGPRSPDVWCPGVSTGQERPAPPEVELA
jgi:hypothetical protein